MFTPASQRELRRLEAGVEPREAARGAAVARDGVWKRRVKPSSSTPLAASSSDCTYCCTWGLSGLLAFQPGKRLPRARVTSSGRLWLLS